MLETSNLSQQQFTWPSTRLSHALMLSWIAAEWVISNYGLHICSAIRRNIRVNMEEELPRRLMSTVSIRRVRIEMFWFTLSCKLWKRGEEVKREIARRYSREKLESFIINIHMDNKKKRTLSKIVPMAPLLLARAAVIEHPLLQIHPKKLMQSDYIRVV